MNRPFTILLLPLITGILFSYYFLIDIGLVLLIISISIFLFIYNIIKDKNNFKILLLMFFTLGLLITRNNNSDLINKYDKRVDGIGVVDEVLNREEGKSRYILKLKEVDNQILNEKIVLNILGNSDLNIGDKLSFNGKLQEPSINGNPRLYNYRLNLMTEKIYSTMSIKDYSIKSIDKESKVFNYKLKHKFTKDIERLYDKYLGDGESSLIKSIILGKSFYLEEENINLYRDLGLAHILAVSGLHIGIISGFFLFVFSRLGIKRNGNILLTLSILWIYAYIIGFPTSILRANIMISILLYSQIVHKPYDSINSLSFAMFILLIINPYYLFNIGFQLSFIASFSIIVFAPRIKDLFYPGDNYIVSSLSSILGVQIGIIPIQFYYFNSFNILSILANLIFIPILSLALILGFIMIIFSYIFTYINIFIGPVLNFILSFQLNLLNRLDNVFASISVFSPEIISIIIYYILILVILKIIDIDIFNKDISKFFIVSLVLVLVFNTFSFINYNKIELHFIDVGQGDSLLIRTRDKDYLVDTGGNIFGDFDIGENITLPYLEKLGIRRLNGVFISHFHEDHYKGLWPLIENLEIDIVFGPYIPFDNLIYEEIIKNDIVYRELKTGDNLKLHKDLSLLNIWPDSDLNTIYSENNMSLVSILSNSNTNILLTGDMEKEVEDIISNRYDLSIDIIKVPHHGSNTSSTKKLLNNIKPDIGIISSGKNNIYGHPDEDIINRYNDIGTSIYRTDESGLIKVVVDNNGYSIKPYLKNGDKEKIDFRTFIYENIFILSFYLIYCMLVHMLLKTTYIWSDGKFEL